MTTTVYPNYSDWTTSNVTTNSSLYDPFRDCEKYKTNLEHIKPLYGRIAITWLLFIFSATGNFFSLYCLYKWKRKTHVQTIALNLTLADFVFTFFTMPNDAIWNLTIQWYGGNALCKICQMMKQFGMYLSSFMVLVTALGPALNMLLPMSNESQQKRRTKILVVGAWTISFISALPPLYVFKLESRQFCPDKPVFHQCVDFSVLDSVMLKVYRFFTMAMSFILPFIFIILSYSLFLCELANMIERDRRMLGRRKNRSMEKARRKTLILTSSTTLTFLLLWGPYYVVAILQWFGIKNINASLMQTLFMLVYGHASVHPFLYGLFVSDFRSRFAALFRVCIKHPTGRRRPQVVTSASDQRDLLNRKRTSTGRISSKERYTTTRN